MWYSSKMELGMRIIFVFFLSAVFMCACDAQYKRVCYYTNWSQYRTGIGKFFPEDIDPDLCTHIVYAFGKLEGNKVTTLEWNDQDLYARINALKTKNPSIKTLLAMGGWTAGSLSYSKMTSSESSRREFITSSIEWLRKYNFDGLDMDWEYPARRGGAPEDYANFGKFVKEAREAFDKEAILASNDRLLLTAAVAAGRSNIDNVYDVKTMAQYMDFICIMTYDLHGAWDPVTGHNSPLDASAVDTDATLNMRAAAEYWNELGAPKQKLIIGLGTYGRSFTLSDPNNYAVGAPASGAGKAGTYTREAGFLSYYEICQMQQSGGNTYRDVQAGVPYYVNNDLWVGFDDARSIYDKTSKFIVGEGYGGAMVWALPLDDFKGVCSSTKYPLMNVMKDVLVAAENGATVPPPSTDVPVTPAPTTGTTGAATTTGGGGGGGGGTGGSVCSGIPNGITADPTDCKSFYMCSSGRGTKFVCGTPLLFDDKTLQCNWPDQVDCSRIVVTPKPTTAATSVTTSPQQTTTSPVVPPTTPDGSLVFTCLNKVPGILYPDPNDCKKFFYCINGRPYRGSCFGFFAFNHLKGVCDWRRNVDCTRGSTSPPNTVATTTPTVVATSTPVAITSTSTPLKGFCAGKADGLYADPTNCARYYNCWSGNGSPQSCQGSLLWNDLVKYCDYENNVKCDDTGVTVPPTNAPTTSAPTAGPTTAAPTTAAPTTAAPTVPSTAGPTPDVDCAVLPDGLYKMSSDCSKYVQCANGVEFVKTCPSGLYFNEAGKYCDWPDNVNCS